ncbi:hypothetical protein AB1Y20_010970 [Prymnesium parvum]|uniref:Uncharacterized protein n=1 Tax=Prymnesium parvum TaxID=97485 RepID=A0AB34ILH9_PRYPA
MMADDISSDEIRLQSRDCTKSAVMPAFPVSELLSASPASSRSLIAVDSVRDASATARHVDRTSPFALSSLLFEISTVSSGGASEALRCPSSHSGMPECVLRQLVSSKVCDDSSDDEDTSCKPSVRDAPPPRRRIIALRATAHLRSPPVGG